MRSSLAISLAVHLAILFWFTSLPQGTIGGNRLRGTSSGGESMRAILRGAPSPHASSELLDSLPDRDAVEHRPGADPTVPQKPAARAAAQPVQRRPSGDSYTSVETRTIFHAPVASYYQLRDLDIRPQVAVHIDPEYPEAAARRMISGTAVIRVFIGDDGKVDRTQLVSTDPPGFFELSAQQAFNVARYTPGVKGGRAVKSQLLIEVTYTSKAPPKFEIKDGG